MNYDPTYLQQALCIQVADSILKRHNIHLYNVRMTHQQNVQQMISCLKFLFQYEQDDRIVSDHLDLYGPAEDFLNTDYIADKIAAKIKRDLDV